MKMTRTLKSSNLNKNHQLIISTKVYWLKLFFIMRFYRVVISKNISLIISVIFVFRCTKQHNFCFISYHYLLVFQRRNSPQKKCLHFSHEWQSGRSWRIRKCPTSERGIVITVFTPIFSLRSCCSFCSHGVERGRFLLAPSMIKVQSVLTSFWILWIWKMLKKVIYSFSRSWPLMNPMLMTTSKTARTRRGLMSRILENKIQKCRLRIRWSSQRIGTGKCQ